MTIFTGGPAIRVNRTKDEFPLGYALPLWQQFQDTFQTNPGSLKADSDWLQALETGVQTEFNPYDQPVYEPIKVTKIDRDSAVKQLKDAGITNKKIPEEGYTQEAVDFLVQRRKEQDKRREIMARAPDEGLYTALKWTTIFGASLLDPVNVATAFVPVVSQSRYAALIANATAKAGFAGRTAVRTGVGAAEGLAGAALVEPIISAGHNYLGDDYTMYDSLMNIAFGGLFGGGLHAIGGAGVEAFRRARGRSQPWEMANEQLSGKTAPDPVSTIKTDVKGGNPLSEHIAGLSPETRQAAMQGALAQLSRGERVNIEPILSIDPKHHIELRDFEQVLTESPRPPKGFAETDGWNLSLSKSVDDIQKAKDVLNKYGIRHTDTKEGVNIHAQSKDIARFVAKELNRVGAVKGKSPDSKQIIKGVAAEFRKPKALKDVNPKELGQFYTGTKNRKPIAEGIREALTEAQRANTPEVDMLSSRSETPHPEQPALARTPADDIDDIMQEVSEVFDSIGDEQLKREFGEIMAEFDKDVAKAEQHAKALRAAALCGVRN